MKSRTLAVITAAILAPAMFEPPPLPGQFLMHQQSGSNYRDRFGFSAAAAGDVDADGRDDVIIGAPQDAQGPTSLFGYAMVISGRDFHTIHVVSGVVTDRNFGQAVAGVGDVDVDGRDDFAVGSPYTDMPNVAGNVGRVVVYSGATGLPLLNLPGPGSSSNYGWAVAGGGDVNGDGISDFVVGCPGYLNGTGGAFVHSGTDGGIIHIVTGDSANDVMGRSVAIAGDVNADGHDDFAAGSIGDDFGGNNTGSVRVFSGFDGSQLYRVDGQTANEQFGVPLAAAGDINSDGTPDLIAGAPQQASLGSNTGRARALSGTNGADLLTWTGVSSSQFFGTAVGGAGDVNGDGHLDLIVGAPGGISQSTGGRAYVYSGSGGALIYSYGSNFGSIRVGDAVAGCGDLDRDGFADFIVGQPNDFANGGYSGGIRIFGGLPPGCSSGTSPAYMCSSGPAILGQDLLVRVFSTPNAPLFVLVDGSTGSQPLGPNGIWGTSQIAFSPVYFSLTDPFGLYGTSFAPPFLDALGHWMALLPVPSVPSLLGVTAYSEAYVLDFFAPNFHFRQTNLLTITFSLD